MDLTQRLDHGRLELLGRLHAQGRALARLALVERRATDGIGERRSGTPPVDLGLRALGLQLIEDARQIADLLLVELQLVGQEAQRPPHAELAAAAAMLEAAGPAPVWAAVMPAMPLPATVAAPLAMLMAATTFAAGMTRLPPAIESWMHCLPPSAGAFAPGGNLARGHHASRVGIRVRSVFRRVNATVLN